MEEGKTIELDNGRYLMLLTNNDKNFQPLLVLLPQWSKATIDKLPKQRQLEIYDQFAHDLSDAWHNLLKAR